MRKINEKGQSLIEAIFSILCLVSTVIGIALASFVFSAKAWLQYNLDSATWCAQREKSWNPCLSKLKENLKLYGPIKNLSITSTVLDRQYSKISGHWEFYKDHKIQFSRQLRIQ